MGNFLKSLGLITFFHNNGFNAMLTRYVEGFSRIMGCKTYIVIELGLPKSCEEM